MDTDPKQDSFATNNEVKLETPAPTISQESATYGNNGGKDGAKPKPSKFFQKLKSQKKILLSVLLLIILIISSIASYLLLNSYKPQTPTSTEQTTPTPFTFKASVKYLSGEASKIIDDRKIEIKEGDVLSEGDVIQTEEGTHLVLELDEGTVIRLGDSTKLTLTKLQSQETTVEDDDGLIFVRVEKDETHKFSAIAGDIVVESLGTTFSVEKEEEEVNVKVFDSKVSVKQGGEVVVEIEKDEEWQQSENKVKEINQEKLTSNEFYNWSLNEEILVEPTSTPKSTSKPEPTSQPSSTTGITLSGSAGENGIFLSWSVSGIDTPKGFKVIKNASGNPVYPGDDFKYLNNAKVRSYTWEIMDGKTWHFRVCQYTDSGCGTYSNDIIVKAPTKSEKTSDAESKVESITLSVTKIEDIKARLKWSVEGYSSSGYKAVWSKSSGPTYPTREGDWFLYMSNSDARQETIGGLESGNTYYFRVCEYLNGSCGVYSNEVSESF